MARSCSSVALVLVMVACIATTPPSSAQSCEELEKKVAELTARIESLEKKQQPAGARAAPPRAAAAGAASGETGKREARALYDTIDELLAAGKVDEANQSLRAFNEKYAGTETVSWTRSLVREMEVVGKATPDDWFIEKWYQGESEAELDGDGPTLIIFWESWCPHCRKEIPNFQKIHDDNKARGLKVVGVTRLTREATEESVKSFIAENNVSYPMAKETGDLATYFNVKGIPAAAVVANGKIVWRGHPQRLNDKMIASWR